VTHPELAAAADRDHQDSRRSRGAATRTARHPAISRRAIFLAREVAEAGRAPPSGPSHRAPRGGARRPPTTAPQATDGRRLQSAPRSACRVTHRRWRRRSLRGASARIAAPAIRERTLGVSAILTRRRSPGVRRTRPESPSWRGGTRVAVSRSRRWRWFTPTAAPAPALSTVTPTLTPDPPRAGRRRARDPTARVACTRHPGLPEDGRERWPAGFVDRGRTPGQRVDSGRGARAYSAGRRNPGAWTAHESSPSSLVARSLRRRRPHPRCRRDGLHLAAER
jgi:hypothetical protein